VDFFPELGFDLTEDKDIICFHQEDIDFQLQDEENIKNWIIEVCKQEGGELGEINYIFCSDEYLHRLNMEYLEHDTLTDIITFPYESFPILRGDLFISIERIQDNAVSLNLSFEEELRRVMVHGILHLTGYLDETDEDEAKMRAKEDEYLAYWNTFR